jgi:hypothetical protein
MTGVLPWAWMAGTRPAKPGQDEISGPISTLYLPCIAGPAEAG